MVVESREGVEDRAGAAGGKGDNLVNMSTCNVFQHIN